MSWVNAFRAAYPYNLGLQEVAAIYNNNRGRDPKEVAEELSGKTKIIDHKLACNLLCDILHSMEARGIDLTEAEDEKWLRATCILQGATQQETMRIIREAKK